MSGSEKAKTWSKYEAAGFVYFCSRGVDDLNHVAELMKVKCGSGTERSIPDLERYRDGIAKSPHTKAYDPNSGRWDLYEANCLIQKIIGKTIDVKGFLSKMAYTEQEKLGLIVSVDITIPDSSDTDTECEDKNYPTAVTSVQPLLSIPATAGGPNISTSSSGKNPLRRTATEDPVIGESSQRAPKRPAASHGASAGGLSGPIAGNFGMGAMSVSLPQIGDSMTATSGSSSLQKIAPEDPGLGETSRRSQKRRAAPLEAYASPQSGPKQAERSLAPADQPALRADQIARTWSKGEDMDDAACERWAITLGSLPDFKKAWQERNKVNAEVRAKHGKKVALWTQRDVQELAYWKAQSETWASIGSKLMYHSETACNQYWNIHMAKTSRYEWVERVRQLKHAEG